MVGSRIWNVLDSSSARSSSAVSKSAQLAVQWVYLSDIATNNSVLRLMCASLVLFYHDYHRFKQESQELELPKVLQPVKPDTQ